MRVRVVNMIPRTRSSEANQDSEPNLAVNPGNPQQLAGTAFTPDPAGGANAPIYVSLDGGNTWVLNSIVPGNGPFGTGDITVRFADSGVLYAGILRGDSSLRLNILRSATFSTPAPMTVLVDRTSTDQPWVQAHTEAGQDHAYVGANNLGATRKASIDRSLDAGTAPAPAGFQQFFVEPRAAVQDGPSVRPVIHADGTVYAAYFGWRTFVSSVITADVVVVRDDNRGTGPNPWTALSDSGDHLAGQRVVTGVQINWFSPFLDQERVGSDLAIAVDPSNSSTVWLAWADNAGGSPYSIHVRRSVDRGQTWSADLRTISSAKNPSLAITPPGQLGFLYQAVAGGRWVTHLELTSNAFATAPTDVVLATVPTGSPARTFLPYIGDYAYVTAVGNDFYGVFCAANTPDMANFPNGVVYQRNADFTTKTLLGVDGVTAVPVSIDPFFFQVSPLKLAKEIKPEIKERLKERVKDFKDVKEIKEKDLKEHKDVKEFKEKELKEKDIIDGKGRKEIKEKEKDIVEGPGIPPGLPVPGEQPGLVDVIAQLAERIDNLERRLAAGQPFIRPEERPAVGEPAPPPASPETRGSRRRPSQRRRG